MLQGYIGKLNDKYDREIGKKRLNMNNKRQDIKDKDEEINYLKSLIADQDNKLIYLEDKIAGLRSPRESIVEPEINLMTD